MEDNGKRPEPCDATKAEFLLNRRQFLFGAGAGLVAIGIPDWLQRRGLPARIQAQLAEYPRQVVGQVSRLKTNDPVMFKYPWDHAQAENFLIKLTEPPAAVLARRTISSALTTSVPTRVLRCKASSRGRLAWSAPARCTGPPLT